MMRFAVIPLVALALMAVLPEAAWACPVCFDSSDENRQAFIATTAFLSLLPLGMVAGAGMYIRKRTRDMDEDSVDSAPLD
ncbi:MAG: hypothetical protein L7S64_01240 [Longimicrobiales bacterium]|jgi:hypothetical protein|nr:hypothetical protein [Longimicrobiales bacterium]